MIFTAKTDIGLKVYLDDVDVTDIAFYVDTDQKLVQVYVKDSAGRNVIREGRAVQVERYGIIKVVRGKTVIYDGSCARV